MSVCMPDLQSDAHTGTRETRERRRARPLRFVAMLLPLLYIYIYIHIFCAPSSCANFAVAHRSRVKRDFHVTRGPKTFTVNNIKYREIFRSLNSVMFSVCNKICPLAFSVTMS